MTSLQLEEKHWQNQHDSRHSVPRTEPLQIESTDKEYISNASISEVFSVPTSQKHVPL